jgi:protein-tyrosine kinase
MHGTSTPPHNALPGGGRNTGAPHRHAIGDYLRNMRSLNDQQMDRIAEYQHDNGLRFGEAAIALRLATSDDVLWALSQQFDYPYAQGSKEAFADELIAAIDPFGDQAEAFRELRSQLLMGALAEGGPRRALAVLSPDVGDGRSFLAANLAVCFSQLGGRTVIVDADLRTPRLHRLFGVPNETGLSNILAGRADDETIYQVRNLPSLYVLPAGTLPPNPLELVQRPATGLLVQELLTKFDHVVIDTPATARGADARVLAARAGAAVLLGRRDHSRIKTLAELSAALMSSHVKLAGITVNEH